MREECVRRDDYGTLLQRPGSSGGGKIVKMLFRDALDAAQS